MMRRRHQYKKLLGLNKTKSECRYCCDELSGEAYCSSLIVDVRKDGSIETGSTNTGEVHF